MKICTYWFDNELELVWLLMPRQIHRFDGHWWKPAGRARGILVRVKTWHGDIFYTRPETMLRWKEECKQHGCTQ